MSDSSLETLARAAGIGVQWTDAYGQVRALSDDTLHHLLGALQLPSENVASRESSLRLLKERAHALPALITADVDSMFDLPPALRGAASITAYDDAGKPQPLALPGEGKCRAPAHHGYYQLSAGSQQLTLAVAPRRCFSVDDSLGKGQPRAWGLGAQVYSLRHPNDGGIGDSRAVAELAAAIGHAGGDALALSPLHAMSPIAGHCSPYSPSHRGFLNWLHADAAQVFGASALQEAIQQSGVASTWQQVQASRLVDWPVAYALRHNVFRVLHTHLTGTHPTLRDQLEHFKAQGGEALRRHAWLSARQSQAAPSGESTSWQAWADDWRDESVARRFAQAHPAEVEFEIFLQWLAACSWEKTAALARDAGQRIGLIWDLAVGFEAGGSEAWAWREHVLDGFELGAPPDAFNPGGQSWGISSYSPWGLQASGLRPFIELLRANMTRGGGIRIDHIIGFRHLWVLPAGRPSSEGGYIRQPLEDLLRIAALESWRHRCIVIGEDLGTVPQGLRDMLAARGVLGLDVLLFTRDEHGEFLAPKQWRKHAVAMTTTHDLPPLAAWREGVDLRHLARAQGWQDDELKQRMLEREQDLARLDAAVAMTTREAGPAAEGNEEQYARYFQFLAQTPSPLLLVPLEDALARKEQPNLPGTIDTHPNWQHRLPSDTVASLRPVLQSIDIKLKRAMSA
ncbi:4-alpha-glucanotransferase [Dyella flagellata]|uniref:4-alpha-glucanotransferase n=1 Tax=Dyella flagellata TaxID=1867833 RepID=A0ABQ5XA40_9GAMM|nr:4-alpha-glucanotransferase [Dyella flagellata]GLQ87463.1 4-alpha-glucanotransferase [Dyella flagellata]